MSVPGSLLTSSGQGGGDGPGRRPGAETQGGAGRGTGRRAGGTTVELKDVLEIKSVDGFQVWNMWRV